MKASKIRAPHRMLPLWLAPCVCLPLLLLFPGEAEPTPHVAAVGVAPISAVVSAAPPSIVAPELPAPPATVPVVLIRGAKRLELDLPVDGKVAPDTADAIARIMRCPTSGRTRRIASGTLALLADVAARFPGHEIEVVSAVRDEPERTRGKVKHSKHWSGHAIDIKVRGAKLSDVRDAVWKNHRDVGVGWYPDGGYIHIDYRPDVHDTSWTQPRRNADNQYNPRWARIARDPGAESAVMRAKMRRLLEASPTLTTLVTSIAKTMGVSTTGIVRAAGNS